MEMGHWGQDLEKFKTNLGVGLYPAEKKRRHSLCQRGRSTSPAAVSSTELPYPAARASSAAPS